MIRDTRVHLIKISIDIYNLREHTDKSIQNHEPFLYNRGGSLPE
jgi:hypothetical protein